MTTREVIRRIAVIDAEIMARRHDAPEPGIEAMVAREAMKSSTLHWYSCSVVLDDNVIWGLYMEAYLKAYEKEYHMHRPV